MSAGGRSRVDRGHSQVSGVKELPASSHSYQLHSSPQNVYPNILAQQPFDAHCCHMGTAVKHPMPEWVKPSFVIFDIRALSRSGLSVRVPGCQKLQMTV